MAEPTLTYDLRGDVAWLQIDDGKANAVSHQVLQELDDALDRAEGEAHAVVIAGRPGRFCAGYDLAVMTAGAEAAGGLVIAGARLMARLYGYPLPVVMACSGHAMAGGALLLLCGDVRIAVDGPFKIGLNEVRIGMPLPAFGRDLARDRLDPRQLTAATVCSQIYDPAGAAAAGFVDRVVAPEAFEAEVQAHAEGLAKLATKKLGARAVAMTKRGLRQQTIDRMLAEVEADVAALLG